MASQNEAKLAGPLSPPELEQIDALQKATRAGEKIVCPLWPMIVLRSFKGWAGPKTVDGLKTEGYWRPSGPVRRHGKARARQIARRMMKSHQPHELFDEEDKLRPEILALASSGDRRTSTNPRANGGLLRHELMMPDFADHVVAVSRPGSTTRDRRA